MTDKTPEALELAGKLYDNGDVPSLEECSQAAALLRRQHQRIEELEKALRSIADTEFRLYSDPSRELKLKEGIASSALLSTTQQEDSQA